METSDHLILMMGLVSVCFVALGLIRLQRNVNETGRVIRAVRERVDRLEELMAKHEAEPEEGDDGDDEC